MPILPFIDLLILAGWTSLFAGFIFKFIWMTTTYRPTFFGITPFDFLIVAGVFLLLSLTLAARTWVKSHETNEARARRRANAEMDHRIEMLDAAGQGDAVHDSLRAEQADARAS